MEGQLAVALVTKNRLSIYTRTLCDVVYAKKQFSWTSKISRTKHDNTSWNQAEQVAKIAMTYTFNFKATHYHSKKIKPNWKLKRVAVIGNHVFYK